MQAKRHDIRTLDRLRKRSCFLRVQKTGRKWVSQSLILQAAPGAQDAPCRFGLTVSRKVSKSAVIRNHIRRRLRAAACDTLPACARPETDYVLIARPETAGRSYAALKKDLKWCLTRLDCLREETA